MSVFQNVLLNFVSRISHYFNEENRLATKPHSRKKKQIKLAFRFRSAPQSFKSNRLISLIEERKDTKFENVASHFLVVLQDQG